MKRDGGVGSFASRMAGSLPSIPDSEKKQITQRIIK